MRSVTLSEDLPLLHAVAFTDQRVKVNGGILVGLLELRQFIGNLCGFEGDELLLLVAVVVDDNLVGIYIRYRAGTFRHHLCAAVFHQLVFDTGTYDRCLARNQGNCLAHHVRTHQCTVGIVVLQERNQGSSHRSNLAWCHVHQVHLTRGYNGEVCTKTGFYLCADELTILIQRRVTLCHRLLFLVLRAEVLDMVVVQIHYAVFRHAIRSLNEAEVVDFRIDTERGDKTDVRTFRRLNRTETTVVGIVHISHLKACTVATQTAGTQGRHTALVRNLRKGSLLVHKLRQRIRTKVGIDNRRDGLGINKVGRREHLVVAHVHTLTNSASHTRKTNAKLVVELLTYGAHTAVRQVVNIIHLSVAVNQLHQVLDNLNDILFG